MSDAKPFYQVLFEQAGEGLLVVGKEGLIEHANPKMLSMFAYDAETDLIGSRIEVLIPERYRGNHVKHHQSFTKDPRNRPMGLGQTLFGLRKTGEEFPVEISLSSFIDANGAQKTLALVSDITQRKVMEDELNSINEELEELVEIRSNELRRSNHLYKSIARNFPNGSIYVFDRQFNYVFADGQELKKRGLSGDELVGKNYSEMMNESIREKVIPSLKRTFLGEEVKFEILYLNSCFFLHAVPLKNGNPDGEIDRILVVERDVSEEKRIEKEIKESLERERELNNLKSRFVTIVSHEFRTPLSAIKSSSELIERYPEGEQQDKRLKHTKRIQSSVNHLNGMIEDILSLSKIEEGKVEFKITDFNLDDVIENIITEHLEVYPKQAIEFEKGEHLISSDRKLVSHIIQNLVSNAFKYSKDDELVSVKVKEEGDGYCVCVKDRGIGIPEADQQKLFERFYRATNVANIKGTGLGLNIVVKYLEHLNGKIRFTSQENQGTEFIVHLPKTRKV